MSVDHDAPPRVQPTRRLPGLDGLRALAITAVVVYHLDPTWLPGGFLGVDLFFVISGFLITRLLLERAASAGSVRIGEFYLRRARRILPATVLLVALLVVVAVLAQGPVRVEAGDVLAGLGFATNWWQIAQGRDYFAAMAAPSSLQHLWSLAIEEQFYLLWPAVLALVVLATRRRMRLTYGVVCGLAIAGALASGAWLTYLAVTLDIPYAGGASRVYYGTDTHASGILVGAAAAALLLRRRATDRPRWWVRVPVELAGLAAVAALGLVALRLGEYDPRLYRGGFLLVAVLGVVAVSVASPAWSVLGRMLDVQPLRWLGVVSFELYLWHWPVTIAWPALAPSASPLWSVPVMLALAAATHYWVTVPIWHPRPARRTWVGVPAVTAAATGVVVLVAFAPAALAGPGIPSVRAAPQPVRSPATPTAPPSLEPTTTPDPRRLGEAALGNPISAFGNSVMLGATRAMRAQMPHVIVLATVSAAPLTIYNEVREAHANGSLARIVVIHGGDNGLIRNNALDRLLDELPDLTLVVLVTVRLPWTLQQTNNDIIAAAAHGHRNAAVADWAAASTGHREYFVSDGIHLTQAGATAFAGLVASTIADFRVGVVRA